LERLFNLLGLGVPFYLSATTFTVFSWLDSNASAQATQDISSWLHGRSHNKPDLGNLIINAFDRIYTLPLLTFRAFGRSAAISSIIWLFVILIPYLFGLAKLWNESLIDYSIIPYLPLVIFILCYCLFTNVLSDYISLPFVRRYLQRARTHPIRASITSSIIGVVIITISVCIMLAVSLMTAFLIHTYLHYDLPLLGMHPNPIETNIETLSGSMYIGTAVFMIHLWLPLFAVSSLAVRLVFPMFRAVEWAQYFLKQGDAHPLKAIGIVATIIVFGSAMLVKEGWALLSVLERS
jgi:hypothetical protein